MTAKEPKKIQCNAVFWEDENGQHIAIEFPDSRTAYFLASDMNRGGAMIRAGRNEDKSTLVISCKGLL